jgi:hypothetical protein
LLSDHERIAVAVAEATAPRTPAATRDDVLAYLAERFDLTPELCALIIGTMMGDMVREARALASMRAGAVCAETPATRVTGEPIRPAPVSGHGVPDYEPNFDPGEVARQVRHR